MMVIQIEMTSQDNTGNTNKKYDDSLWSKMHNSNENITMVLSYI